MDGWYKDNYNMLLFYFASLSLFVMLAFFITNNFINNNSIFGISFQKVCCQPLLLSPMASSGNNLYIVWPDNKTGNWELFFTRSVDGGHTFDIPVNISNNTSFSANATIIAHENHVSISWWDNKTGEIQPFVRSSHNNGESFENTLMLNTSFTG
ncbi:hypothetical protein NMY3_03481 [Candidatus Nitrosocosmicus oleophilus]|uniref:Exo-alpha-sialidase n=2 Tax=Candidatus Nitrosocosmicus oleophilus TaxID=1353260 RepID=A0A654M4J6_9ARCH|nr:hypothetical protein NMY3_03481 [Candidatus Nitrosocosmicus oleophilus]